MSTAEIKQCQSCKNQFLIEPDDFAFYEKMRVAVPELCPECGLQRLMALRNERILYKRTCDKCAKSTLSMYPAETPYTVYCTACWWADDWDGSDYATEYDPNRSLMEQVNVLQRKVPREALVNLNSPDCDYCNHIRDSRNCYLCALVSDKCDNAMYSNWIVNTQDTSDGFKNLGCQRCYGCLDIYTSYNCVFLQDASSCRDCYFSFDLQGCSDCILCVGLRNKSYCINNVQCTKEEYKKEFSKYIDGSYATLRRNLEALKTAKAKFIRRYADTLQTKDSTGNHLQNCNRAAWCFDGVYAEDVKRTISILYAKNVHYGYAVGTQPVEWSCGISVIKGGSNITNSYNLFNSTECSYCDSLISCNNCIGSVGMKRKNYCILNKQYSKEEYRRIQEVLYAKGELQRFIPPSFSTFAFNETAASYYYPLSKDEALKQGYVWCDTIPMTTGTETIPMSSVPDDIHDVGDDFTQQILACEKCGRNYRIIGAELALYRQLLVPIPHRCPFCRMQGRFDERNPEKLWHRQCMCNGHMAKSKGHMAYNNTAEHFHGESPCPNEFETSYSPDRPEIVYCEQCYNAEVV